MGRKRKADQAAADPGTDLAAPISAPSPAAVLQVRQWIVDGQQSADIMESIAEHFPAERADLILGAALADMSAEAERLDIDLARGFLLNAYREIYRRGLEINDFGTALGALRAFERVAEVAAG